jgi:pSer/pThr/pTyr-binding forkhead associated (FHA) protein
VVLSDDSVSGQHCRIRPEAGHFALHDLESTNGTFVNGRRVGRHQLAEGDVIRIGETSIEFRMLR